MITLDPLILDAIRPLGTSLVADAIETFQIRLANEGFIQSGVLDDMTPEMPAMLGYAVTARLRTIHPPMPGALFTENTAWWRHLLTMPEPRIIVLQDCDHSPGLGAFIGGMHAAIHQALGCIGVVTNGAVRDLDGIRNAGIHCYARHLSVSRAYAHVIEFGVPLEIGGLKINPADLLYGDGNGVLSLPLDLVSQIPAIAADIREKKHQTIGLCTSGNFSIAKLEELAVTLGYGMAQTGMRLDTKLKNRR